MRASDVVYSFKCAQLLVHSVKRVSRPLSIASLFDAEPNEGRLELPGNVIIAGGGAQTARPSLFPCFTFDLQTRCLSAQMRVSATTSCEAGGMERE